MLSIIMLRVTNKPIILSVVMLSIIMLSAIYTIFMLSIIMQSAILLNVIKLSAMVHTLQMKSFIALTSVIK
jgi:hypothetical protein